ncbi:zinc-alpha-2-glycoprotein-like [Astyanax mexicanus]|uniref:zinc-alpha-2-glycoprotein-like n=1 Tax=Astyanax mexicanus TaxID=7994 RepID=UPI0020CAD708|nr:zinc-alpha-2-glycoprotein-like [Astyanax mexicanus]
MQSKNSYYHLYDCTAVTLLNYRQIDFYNSSSDKPRTAKQNWLKNISESDWKTSTEKLQYDRELLNRLIDQQLNEFRHSQSDGHVLQWRQGCEVDRSLLVVKSISELAYDGIGLIYFNCTSETWLTSGKPTDRMLEKWNKDYRLIAIKKCEECVRVLEMYLQYRTANTTDINTRRSPPAVHMFAKKSIRDSRKRILTCMATGFYPKDVKMSLRKFTTEIPDHLITSSGVRPNHNGTYQLRKSVEIQEDDKADYYCHVSHSSLTEPVIKEWDGKCINCTDGRSRTGLIVVLISVVVLIICVLICAGGIGRSCRSSPTSNHSIANSKC